MVAELRIEALEVAGGFVEAPGRVVDAAFAVALHARGISGASRGAYVSW